LLRLGFALLFQQLVLLFANRAILRVEVAVTVAVIHGVVAMSASVAVLCAIVVRVLIVVAATLVHAAVIADLNDASVRRHGIAHATLLRRGVHRTATEDDVTDGSALTRAGIPRGIAGNDLSGQWRRTDNQREREQRSPDLHDAFSLEVLRALSKAPAVPRCHATSIRDNTLVPMHLHG
jgi:hypothetical protein